ncbi:MAG: polysaccharide biosynthesis tyrosine autokinase, partial [Cytophagales bacterium]
QGTCIEKEKDFINIHCQSFVKISLNDKNQTQERTIGFIDNQLGLISDTLAVLENRMILYRKKFNSSNVEVIAEKRFVKLELLEEEKAKYALNQRYFDYLKEYLVKQSDYTDLVAPSNIGITDPNLNQLLVQLGELKMKQNTVFKTENLQSPFRIDNENKINQVKKNMIEVIKNIENSNQLLYKDINNRIEQVTKLTSSILDNERNYIDLKRKYKINEELYNILLKKKSELAITRAGNVSDTKIIDLAFVSGVPYPVASKVYSTYLILALMLPLAFVLFKYISNYRIMEKDDIIAVCNMPFLGSIGHISDETKMIMVNKPKSSLAESFRSIRANLYYFLPKPDQKIILITSSLSAEGKTFSSVNISSALAVSGKKTILIGADLRKPKVYLDLNTRGQMGLSNYLVNKATMGEIIMNTEVENFYFISSGLIPPNPAELLASPRMFELIMDLKKDFDYIVIDTPPIGLVTDALPLMQFSDINIYIVRHGYTQTKFLKDLNEMVQNGIVKNLAYIFNDYDISKNYGYGYKYGYYRNSKYGSGYYEGDETESKGWWSSLKKVFRSKKSKVA